MDHSVFILSTYLTKQVVFALSALISPCQGFVIPVVLTTISPLVSLYNTHNVWLPVLRPAPNTKTLGWQLEMVFGSVFMRSVQVEPSPSHTRHASNSLPLFGTPSHPAHVVLVPLHTPKTSISIQEIGAGTAGSYVQYSLIKMHQWRHLYKDYFSLKKFYPWQGT